MSNPNPAPFKITFEVELVPAAPSNTPATLTAEDKAPVYVDEQKSGLARVTLGGQDFNLVIGKTRVL